MTIHPLFAGFSNASPHAVGAALGFVIHIETALGSLPAALDGHQRSRTREGGDLEGFLFAGGWEAPRVHCLMFAKPLTPMAKALWRVGVVNAALVAGDHSPCPFCGGPSSQP